MTEPPRQTDVTLLSPEFAISWSQFCAAMEFRNSPVATGETLRTVDRQEWLYALGRTIRNPGTASGREGLGATVTEKDGVTHKSVHQSGDAADFVPIIRGLRQIPPIYEDDARTKIHPVYRNAREVCASLGLRYGLSWGDAVHVEMRRDGSGKPIFYREKVR